MSEVAIITDSSTCLPRELAERFNIQILPISSHGDLLDEAILAPESDLRLPSSVELDELDAANHPFVTEYLAAIEGRRCDAAVVVTPAIEFATMYRNAALAAELSTRHTVVVDARTAAAGQALVVLAGAAAAANGAPLEEVVAVIEGASRDIELVASLATLEPIRQNGLIPGDVFDTSDRDAMRSVFRMHDGVVEPLGAGKTEDDTLQEISDRLHTSSPKGVDRSTVFHAGVPNLAVRLEQLIGKVDFVSGFSVAMQVHTGRGVVGAAWLPRR